MSYTRPRPGTSLGFTAFCVAVTTLLLVLAGLAYHSLQRALGNTQAVTTEITREVEDMLLLQRQLEQAALPVHHFHMKGEAEQREHFAHASGHVEQLLRTVINTRSGQDRVMLEQARTQWLSAKNEAQKLLALPDPLAVPIDHVHHQLHGTDTKIKVAVATIEAVQERDRARVTARLDQLRQDNLQLVGLVIGSFVCTLIACVLGAFLIWRNQQAFKELSVRDGLTGLYNRREFQAQLERQLFIAERSAAPCALLLLDIDHFKSINDTFGHQRGDDVLQSVAHIVAQQARRSDVVARYGGEELAVILPGTPRETALILAERVRSAIQNAAHTALPGAPVIPLTVSVGVAAYPHDGARSQELIAAADAAMYQAKQSGRNQVRHYQCPPLTLEPT